MPPLSRCLGAVSAVALLVLWSIAQPATARADAEVAPDFELRSLASGLDQPVAVAWAPDGRMFVAEYPGTVRVVAGGQLLANPLIDISDHVNAFGDRGLLGIAVDADFATNHYLYLLYVYGTSDHSDSGPMTSRLTRVIVRPDNTVVNPSAPETVIVGRDDTPPCPPPANEVDCIPADYISHAIGTVRADSDGTLWLGSGDASPPGQRDPRSLRAYDERSYVGKVLHVDREGRGLPGHPFCATDNNLTHTCTKVYAKGFRNPFRFVLRGNGLGPIVGDVGESSWDEIDLASAGKNYGWPCWEGAAHQPGWGADPACDPVYSAGGTTAPDFAYPGTGEASGGSNAVVGGPVYPGGEYPASFNGEILFGDWSHGFIRRLRFTPSGPVVNDLAFGAQVLDLQLGPSGNLVYVDAHGFAPGAGTVDEINYCPANCAPLARAGANPLSGDPPLTVAFKGDGSSDPDGDTLTYDWDFGDGSAHTATRNPVHEYSDAGSYVATLTVTDPGERSRTASVLISVGNTPPRPSIDAPAAGTLYTDGKPIQLKGSAHDPEEGAVDPSALEWRVMLHHLNHLHPYTTLSGDSVTFTPATDHDLDSYLEITLTARDNSALTGTSKIELRPRPINVLLRSSPAGAPLVWGSKRVVAPFATAAAAGLRTTAAAATTFRAGGRIYEFRSWSNGKARNHSVAVGAAGPLELVARYRDVTPDAVGPELGFEPERGAQRAKSGRLAGSAIDPSGVRKVRVALRTVPDGSGRCHWWLREFGRLAHAPTSCSTPRWMEAGLHPRPHGVWWRAQLGASVPAGRYEVLFRASDTRGNVSRSVGGRRHIPIVVR